MRGRLLTAALAAAAFLSVASPARAQMTVLTRCRAAFPCSEPIGLQPRPDPRIAGPWAQGAPSSAVSAHVVLQQNLKIELDQREPPPDDAVVASVRFFMKKHPGPGKSTAKDAPGAAAAVAPTAAQPPAVEPKPEPKS